MPRPRSPRRAGCLPALADSPGPFDGLPLAPGEDLVAAGGDLEPGLLWHAYRHGVFPWYPDPLASGRGPVLWWSPDPRAVLPLEALHVPRRLARTLAGPRFRCTRDGAFREVLEGCAADRADGTWLHAEMRRAYEALHAQGRARSFEVYEGDRLVGGLYGVALPPVFCAESKFHRTRDASKAALVHACRTLAAEGFTHLEVQFLTPHLATFGVVEVARAEYLALLPERLPPA